MSLALWDERGDDVPRHHPHPHPARRFRLDLHRHLWDSSRCGELASRCGADAAPVPAPLDRPDPLAWLNGPVRPDPSDVNDHSWASARWAAEAELLLGADGDSGGVFTVRLGARDRRAFELVAPDDHHVPTFRPLREALPPQAVAALPVLPEAAPGSFRIWRCCGPGWSPPIGCIHLWPRRCRRPEQNPRPGLSISPVIPTECSAGARSTGSPCGTGC
ncbi:hypothetical protein [Actinomadura sp. CNU-125]|uniref:hypothetical protein n=1 Tax=Actinomadura sp. CNU-125 TaxID=1904961 RepID=UPI0021CC78D2|nr:hypothetical protein [Actinomadura sp. CNU-125]